METADSQARVDRWARVLRKLAIVMGLILLFHLAAGALLLIMGHVERVTGGTGHRPLLLVLIPVSAVAGTALMLAALVAPFSVCLAIGVLLEASRENRRAKRIAWVALGLSVPYLLAACMYAYVFSRF